MTRKLGRRPLRAGSAASFRRAASAWSGKTKAGSRCGAMRTVGLAIGSNGGMPRPYAGRPGISRPRRRSVGGLPAARLRERRIDEIRGDAHVQEQALKARVLAQEQRARLLEHLAVLRRDRPERRDLVGLVAQHAVDGMGEAKPVKIDLRREAREAGEAGIDGAAATRR